MIDPIFLVFALILVLFSIGVKLGYDPAWFLMLCGFSGLCVYMMNYLPIQLSWWVISKMAGG